jgi:serine/threonine protein kinase
MAACEIEQHLVQQGDFIAQGGQGKVYKAIYAGQQVAMKVVKVEGTLLKRQQVAEEFMREVDLTTRLRHPNIVQIYGVVTSDTNYLKVVMDYAPNGSLRDLLDQNPSVSLPETTQLNYIKQLCHGIEYLHGAKVAHRDFKSLNVLLYDDSWFCSRHIRAQTA